MRRLLRVLVAALPLACGAQEPAAPAVPAAPAEAAPAQAAPAVPAAPLRLVPLTTAKPQMPDDACRQRLSGSVDLDFVVLPDGSVAQVVVTASDPKGVFDAAASGAVAQSTYAPQAAPVKMHRRMLLNPSDCRAEQLRASAAPADDAAAASKMDCLVLSSEAKGAGERFAPADAGRAVLQGQPSQAYWAPGAACPIKGRMLRPGSRLTAHVEYQGFTLVSGAKGGEETAVWVRSNELKDVEQ